jgi:hypothetical protein
MQTASRMPLKQQFLFAPAIDDTHMYLGSTSAVYAFHKP